MTLFGLSLALISPHYLHERNRKTHPEPTNLDAAILKMLCSHNVDLVILTGYVTIHLIDCRI